MKNVKPPQFLTDLYRDLRDRHLLLPAVALLVGLVAVPVMLSRSSDGGAVAPPPATAVADDGSPTVPAVLAEQSVGVRDYRKRLDQLKSKNPFKQQYTSAPKSEDLSGVTGGVTPPVTPTSTSSSSATVGTGSSSTSSSTSPTTSGTTPTSGGTSTPTPSTHGGSDKPELRFFAWRIDARVGPAGDVKRRDDIGKGTFLPGAQKPVVTFLGVPDAGKRALFAVSPDVTSVDTEGTCQPTPAICQYLVLKVGEQAKLAYFPDGKTYNLHLLDTDLVPVKKPGGRKASARYSGDDLQSRG